ncbi:hypothetical protein ISCGN_024566 [Ixodes scapularis]
MMDDVLSAPCVDRTVRASRLVKWSVLVLVLLLSRTQLVRLRSRPKGGPCWTLLDLAYTILVLGSAVLTSVNIYYMLWENELTEVLEKSALKEISAQGAMALSLVILAVLCWSRISRTLGASAFSCGILGLLATSTITDSIHLVRQLFQQQETIVWQSTFEQSRVAITTAVAVLVCGCFLSAGLQDTVFRKSSRSRKVT